MSAAPDHRKPRNYPVEAKVTASTGAGAVTPFVLWVLGKYLFGGAAVPDPVAALVMFIVPAVVVFVTGWVTRHTPRPAVPPGIRQ